MRSAFPKVCKWYFWTSKISENPLIEIKFWKPSDFSLNFFSSPIGHSQIQRQKRKQKILFKNLFTESKGRLRKEWRLLYKTVAEFLTKKCNKFALFRPVCPLLPRLSPFQQPCNDSDDIGGKRPQHPHLENKKRSWNGIHKVFSWFSALHS